jgi:hypothetical protein
MSRHEIVARDPAHKIIVGWDPPLMTFFAQVMDRRAEEAGWDDKFLLWVGCSCQEIYEVEQLARKISKYAVLTPEIGSILYGDKDEGR